MDETNAKMLTNEKNITVKKAAEMMGKSEQFIRIRVILLSRVPQTVHHTS